MKSYNFLQCTLLCMQAILFVVWLCNGQVGDIQNHCPGTVIPRAVPQ